jgi:DNA-binding NtrC family response regulator
LARDAVAQDVVSCSFAATLTPHGGFPPGSTSPPTRAWIRPRLGADAPVSPLNRAVDELEARLIDAALERAQGNKARAAVLLDIGERALWYKLKKLRPEQSGS